MFFAVVFKFCSYILPSLNQSNEFTGCEQLDMICRSTKGPRELDLVLLTFKLIKRKPLQSNAVKGIIGAILLAISVLFRVIFVN
jgi:hypothetical protein